MQLQPFRRPASKAAEDTRAFLLRNLPSIRDNYACHTDDLLAAVAVAGVPKPGDLYDWDKLVDGCLYFDTATAYRPYYIMMNGPCGWYEDKSPADSINTVDIDGTEYEAAQAEKAVVIAVGLKTPDEFSKAMKDHRASLLAKAGA